MKLGYSEGQNKKGKAKQVILPRARQVDALKQVGSVVHVAFFYHYNLYVHEKQKRFKPLHCKDKVCWSQSRDVVTVGANELTE